jgi:hypothetical protein
MATSSFLIGDVSLAIHIMINQWDNKRRRGKVNKLRYSTFSGWSDPVR